MSESIIMEVAIVAAAIFLCTLAIIVTIHYCRRRICDTVNLHAADILNAIED